MAQCKKWLKTSYGSLAHEWVYQPIKRKVIIEKLLRDDKEKIPKDYKFFMIHGECCLIQVDHDRFINHSRTLYDSDWNFLDISLHYKKGLRIEKPHNLNLMLSLAQELSRKFDFIRVDFYEVKNKLYFGELTHYPESGMGKFEPSSFDFELGEYWKLKPRYWEKTINEK